MNDTDIVITTKRQWNGQILLSCEGRSVDQIRQALTKLVQAHADGLFGLAQLQCDEGVNDKGQLVSHASNVHGTAWLLLSNLLCAEDKSTATLKLQSDAGEFDIAVQARWYAHPFPQAEMECDLDELTDVMQEFVLLFEFKRSLLETERESFCAALDVWASLVDAGAFPMEESVTYPSVIAAYSSRFEDTATAGVYSEGIGASPSCFGLLIQLANRWNDEVGVENMALEHMP